MEKKVNESKCAASPEVQVTHAPGTQAPKTSRKTRKRRKQTRAPVGSGTLVKHGKFYHARWRVNGKLVSKSLKTEDEEEARAELARLSVPRSGLDDRTALRKIATVMSATLEDIAEANRVASIPVGDLFKLFSSAPNRNPVGVRTLAVYGGQFSVFEKWLALRHPEITNARDISQGVADEYVQHRRDEGKSSNTVNKDLNLFAQTWRILAGRYALEYNPWTEEHIARGKLQPNRRRNLTAKECKAVMETATLEERAAIQVALCCAFRLGDVVRLKWSDIDFDERWIGKVQHKTGKFVSIPLADAVAETLLEWRKARPNVHTANHASGQKEAPLKRGNEEAAPDLVFPSLFAKLKEDGDSENVSRMFTRLFRRAGIETQRTVNGKKVADATFHSLRHTFVTNLMQAGVNPLLVKEAAGHSVMATTAGYTHIGETQLRRAFDKAAKNARKKRRVTHMRHAPTPTNMSGRAAHFPSASANQSSARLLLGEL